MAEVRNNDDKAFLGVGVSFPIAVATDGEIASVAHEEDIRQALRMILETNPGERLMRPDFGAGLRALAFEPLNATTVALTRHRVETAIVQWEPRVDSVSVDVTTDPPLGRMMIEMRYRVRALNTFYNLVYPFYLIEGDRA